MKRRNLASTAMMGAAAAAVLPVAASAKHKKYENLVFTAEDPGHWASVEALHVPVVDVADGVMTVKTPHPMTAPHFIVSHSVVLEGGVFLDRATFVYTDQPVSTHTLPAGYKGRVFVTSTCNLHDLWVKMVKV
ncbi:MAG: desulfoferrodoxin family protein [Acidocella sp.]|nr:desulfoferrodoxin family protein [Acidocella sp.]